MFKKILINGENDMFHYFHVKATLQQSYQYATSFDIPHNHNIICPII